MDPSAEVLSPSPHSGASRQVAKEGPEKSCSQPTAESRSRIDHPVVTGDDSRRVAPVDVVLGAAIERGSREESTR